MKTIFIFSLILINVNLFACDFSKIDDIYQVYRNYVAETSEDGEKKLLDVRHMRKNKRYMNFKTDAPDGYYFYRMRVDGYLGVIAKLVDGKMRFEYATIPNYTCEISTVLPPDRLQYAN